MTKRDVPTLNRLGPVPFWRGTNKCLAELRQLYRRAMERAEARLSGGESLAKRDK